MKLSRPIINQIRFDKDYSHLKNVNRVKTRAEYDAYCDHDDEEDGKNEYQYMVGIRFRIWMYVDKIENEVVGYLSEAEAVVLEHKTPDEDLPMLEYFSNDMYNRIKKILTDNLTGFDLSELPDLNPAEFASHHSRGLIQLGLYK